jgi:hypothetical protein
MILKFPRFIEIPLVVKNFTPSLDNVILFIKHPERSLILNAEIYYG